MKTFRELRVWQKAHKLNQVDYQKLLDLSDEVGKMLYSFHKKLNTES